MTEPGTREQWAREDTARLRAVVEAGIKVVSGVGSLSWCLHRHPNSDVSRGAIEEEQRALGKWVDEARTALEEGAD